MFKTIYESDRVIVRQDTSAWEIYRVTVCSDTGRKKTCVFRGESAWCDAERFACDHDNAAVGCTQEV